MTLLTITAAAERLGVSRRTVEREIADGALAVIEIRGLRRIDANDIDSYLSARKITRVKPCPSENVETLGMSAFRSAAKESSALLDRLLQKRTRSTTKRNSAAT